MRNWRKLDQGGEVWGVWAGGAIFSGPVRERLKEVRGEADTGGRVSGRSSSTNQGPGAGMLRASTAGEGNSWGRRSSRSRCRLRTGPYLSFAPVSHPDPGLEHLGTIWRTKP